jgi:probable rRNA maturation factor
MTAGSARPRPRFGPDGGEPTVFVADERPGEPPTPLIDLLRWSRFATAVLRELGVEGEAELSMMFVDEPHIARLNQRHLGHEGPTDVLAFPIDGSPDLTTSGLAPGRATEDPDDQPLLLGDVVICPAVAERQAPEHAGSLDDELALLLVHGVLHVMGMDHATDDDRIAMQARERELLGKLHGTMARDPWADEPLHRREGGGEGTDG